MDLLYNTTGDQSAYMSAATVGFSDTVNIVAPNGITRPTRAIFVSTQAGAVALSCVFADGSTAILNVPAASAGFTLNLALVRINATGTTAGAGTVIALW